MESPARAVARDPLGPLWKQEDMRWVVPPRGGFSPHPPTPLTQSPGELGLEEGFS